MMWFVEEGRPTAWGSMALASRAANERARRYVDEVGPDEADSLWAFFCECGDEDCCATVELTVAEFDDLLEQGEGRVTAVGHGSSRAAKPRRTIRFRASLSDAELLDAGEDVGLLLDTTRELDLAPATSDFLRALDDAITDALP